MAGKQVLFIFTFVLAAVGIGLCQYEDPATLPTALEDLQPCYIEGYAEDPQNCTRFSRCVDYGIPNKPILLRHDFSCGPGTIFDRTLSVCNHPHHVKGTPACQTQYTYVGQTVIGSNNAVLDQYVDDEDLVTSDNPRADPLIQTRFGSTTGVSIPERHWPVNYVKAVGSVVHYQVQVPYKVR